jgi:hypothetical protein
VLAVCRRTFFPARPVRMNLASLQHLVRSVRTLTEDCEVIVLGSASLLASFPEMGDFSQPLATTFDADLCPQPFDETTALR